MKKPLVLIMILSLFLVTLLVGRGEGNGSKGLKFTLSGESKKVITFEVKAPGSIKLKIKLSGKNPLTADLFGPGKKTSYQTINGTGILNLSQEVTEIMISTGSSWYILCTNSANSPMEIELAVESPAEAILIPIAENDANKKSACIAFIAHLLDRYVNDAPNKTDLDQKLKDSLDKIAGAKQALKASVAHWRSIPSALRQTVFGEEFGDLPMDADIQREKMIPHFKAEADKPLKSLGTGILGIHPLDVSLSNEIPLPKIKDLPQTTIRKGKIDPTYRIDYAGLYCQKETVWDQSSNSDEPYVIFAVTDGWKTWSKRSDVYSDVDSGESRGPSPALFSLYGEVGPSPARDMALISTVMENDFGDPNYYKATIHSIVEAARLAATAYGIPVPEFVANLVVEGINWFIDSGDDEIGLQAVVLQKGAFHGTAFTSPVSFKGLSYNLLSPVHSGGAWWNNAKYYVMYNIRHDPSYIPIQKWSGWEYLGGPIASGPAVASWSDNRLDVFVTGTNKHLMHKWWNGKAWSGWEDLGGNLTQAPAAVSWGPNRIDCFGRGKDGNLVHKWWNGATWSYWENLGGPIASGPAVASWSDNRLDVFVTGTNKHLMHKWWNGKAWSGWEDLGGSLTQTPAAVSWGPNRIDCFGRGSDGYLWHKCWDGVTWSSWNNLGGPIASGPAVASWSAKRLDVFVTGTNKHLMHKWWSGAWSGWEDLKGELTQAPAAVSWGPNRIDCFSRGKDGYLWHKWTWLE